MSRHTQLVRPLMVNDTLVFSTTTPINTHINHRQSSNQVSGFEHVCMVNFVGMYMDTST